MRPLPKSMLIHTAELKEVSTDNTWQEEQLTDVAVLRKIRIEPMSKLITTKDNRQITLSAVLFYDCRVSRPENVKFKQGQKIFRDGTEYVIETIEPLYERNTLHHYELGLI